MVPTIFVIVDFHAKQTGNSAFYDMATMLSVRVKLPGPGVHSVSGSIDLLPLI